jgi:hypothetical protein
LSKTQPVCLVFQGSEYTRRTGNDLNSLTGSLYWGLDFNLIRHGFNQLV